MKNIIQERTQKNAPKNASKNVPILSLYIDGQYCECNVHSLPYLKGTAIMLPLHVVVPKLNYRLDHHNDLGYDLVYKDSIFEPEALTIRYVKKPNGALAKSYYFQKGQLINLPPVEIQDDELFVPMELLTAALNCTCQASDSGNINVRSISAPTPPSAPTKLLSETDTSQ